MNERQVREYIASFNCKWQDFMQFMIGQTVSSDEQGNIIYWPEDVEGFVLEQKTGNVEPDFD